MTRRDIAALRLAYEWLRGSAEAEPHDIGTISVALEEASSAMAWCHWMEPFHEATDLLPERGSQPYRLLRAHLALYLRAVLRAEAGDFADDDACSICGEVLSAGRYERGDALWGCPERTAMLDGDALPLVVRRSVRPLWQSPDIAARARAARERRTR